MIQNDNLEIQIQELSEIQSKLADFGNEYLKLASELAVLTLTLSTQPDELYQKLKENLDCQLMAVTSATKSISQQVKTAQQSVASAQSTSKSTMSGEQAAWLQTLSDSWTTCFNTLSTTHQKNYQKLSTQLIESVQSALEQWDSTATSKAKA